MSQVLLGDGVLPSLVTDPIQSSVSGPAQGDGGTQSGQGVPLPPSQGKGNLPWTEQGVPLLLTSTPWPGWDTFPWPIQGVPPTSNQDGVPLAPHPPARTRGTPAPDLLHGQDGVPPPLCPSQDSGYPCPQPGHGGAPPTGQDRGYPWPQPGQGTPAPDLHPMAGTGVPPSAHPCPAPLQPAPLTGVASAAMLQKGRGTSGSIMGWRWVPPGVNRQTHVKRVPSHRTTHTGGNSGTL